MHFCNGASGNHYRLGWLPVADDNCHYLVQIDANGIHHCLVCMVAGGIINCLTWTVAGAFSLALAATKRAHLYSESDSQNQAETLHLRLGREHIGG